MDPEIPHRNRKCVRFRSESINQERRRFVRTYIKGLFLFYMLRQKVQRFPYKQFTAEKKIKHLHEPNGASAVV